MIHIFLFPENANSLLPSWELFLPSYPSWQLLTYPDSPSNHHWLASGGHPNSASQSQFLCHAAILKSRIIPLRALFQDLWRGIREDVDWPGPVPWGGSRLPEERVPFTWLEAVRRGSPGCIHPGGPATSCSPRGYLFEPLNSSLAYVSSGW